MKLFFPEISYCFGGGTPAVETITAEAPSSRCRRRRRQGNATKHWQPALAAIAEDGGAREVRRQRGGSAVSSFRSEKKPLIFKSKLAGKTRSDSFGSDYYRESTNPMALPAFSPAPFLV